MQITKHGWSGAAADALDDAARRFARDRVLRWPAFFDADLLTLVQRHLVSDRFTTRVAERVYPPAIDLKLRDERVHGLLHFLLNEPSLVAAVRGIAGESGITGFVGAVYRILPGAGHRDAWHTDADGNRRVAVTINLSEDAFEGGEFQMRERATGRAVATIANTGPGDAVLFAIDPALEHCIAPMRGHTGKTALAGWFCVDPSR